jgi:hypothetical protein
MNSLDVFVTVSERELDDLIREVGECASLVRLHPIVPSLDNAPSPRFTAEDHMPVCTDVHETFKQMLLAMDFEHEKMEVRFAWFACQHCLHTYATIKTILRQ